MYTSVLHCSNGKVFLQRPSNALVLIQSITTTLLCPHQMRECVSVCLCICVCVCLCLCVKLVNIIVYYSTVGIWDVRNLRTTGSPRALIQKISLSRTVTSSYYDPINGTKLLTTSLDDQIRYQMFMGTPYIVVNM